MIAEEHRRNATIVAYKVFAPPKSQPSWRNLDHVGDTKSIETARVWVDEILAEKPDCVPVIERHTLIIETVE